MLGRLLGGALAAFALMLGLAAAPAARADAGPCGLSTAPVWIDYGEGSLTPDVRAVFARPGVVVASSGIVLPAFYRSHGAATVYFVLHLPPIVGNPSAPADPASIPTAAANLLAQAQASTACSTPWIGLNELLGSASAEPWSAANAQYRANLLALMQQLAAGGARPFLLVHGNPTVAGATANWWRQVAQVGDIVYEAYYDASHINVLGPLVGNRRMRLGMRLVIGLFASIGIPPGRLGVALGFHSATTPGIAGRQGLQPREAWLRLVKWEALSARQVAQEAGIATVWSWGWGTFGPGSADPDKAAAACVYLWTRDPTLCDGPAAGGPGFETSLAEGQIVLADGVYCSFGSTQILTSSIDALAALTGDRHSALSALFARAALRTVPVSEAGVVAAERRAISRTFGGRRVAYVRALSRRHVAVEIARAIIRDELRRRTIASMLTARRSPETTLQWTDDRESRAADAVTCLHDDLPGSGNFPQSDAREIGVVPLLSLLPFLLPDHAPPAPPAGVTATPASGGIALAWSYGADPDLAGYQVFRATTSGGPYSKLTAALLPRPAFVDTAAPPGAPSFYVVHAVDTSGNLSPPSAEVAAAPS